MSLPDGRTDGRMDGWMDVILDLGIPGSAVVDVCCVAHVIFSSVVKKVSWVKKLYFMSMRGPGVRPGVVAGAAYMYCRSRDA